jgi:inner membrane protein
MMGRSHLAFNAASAVVMSSFVHIGGEAYSWSYLLALLDGHTLITSMLMPSLTQKCIYYLLVLFGALLPDIDHPNSILGRRCRLVSYALHRWCGHRSITHSILGLFLILALCVGLGSLVIALCGSQGIIFSASSRAMLYLALLSLLFGYALHLLADSLTKEGIPLLWPHKKRYGLIPLVAFRFRVGTWAEHALLWSLIFCVGVGFGAGSFSF